MNAKIKCLLYHFIILFCLIISLILLDENYKSAYYTFLMLLILIPFIIGVNNSNHYLKYSLGKTRNEIFKEYIYSILKFIIISFIYLCIINLFIYLIYKNMVESIFNIVLLSIIIYTFSFVSSSIGLIIANILNNSFKNMKVIKIISLFIIIFILISAIFLLYIFEYKILCIIINIILSIILIIIDKYVIKVAKI